MQVSIKSDGSPYGGVSILTEGGDDLASIAQEVVWSQRAGESPRADVTLSSAAIDASGVTAGIYVGGKEVRRIEYADGSVVEFPE